MTEVFLDSQFWNRVLKILKPATIVVVKKNKGVGKDSLIPLCSSIFLDSSSIEHGFLYGLIAKSDLKLFAQFAEKDRLTMVKGYSTSKGLTKEIVKEVERAILNIAICDGLLPEVLLYEGSPVIALPVYASGTAADPSFGFTYFIRNQDIYKIGITDNLLRRMGELKPDEILNSVRCKNYKELEKEMHAHFKSHRIPQTEYFRLDPAGVEEAHAMLIRLADFGG